MAVWENIRSQMFRLLLSNLTLILQNRKSQRTTRLVIFVPVGWNNLLFATEGLRRTPSPCTLTWQHQGPGLSLWAACHRGSHLSMFSFKIWGQNSLKIGKNLVNSHLVLEELKEVNRKKMYCHYICCLDLHFGPLLTYWLVVKLFQTVLKTCSRKHVGKNISLVQEENFPQCPNTTSAANA